MNAAARYAARIDAVNAQHQRIAGRVMGPASWDRQAARFRYDPRRPLDPNLEIVAGYLELDDVVLDVGGGAGRIGLPLALRCREVVNVEPSAGMNDAFHEAAREAGIENVRVVQADWLAAGDIEGDVTLVFNVTYFVREIVPFIEKLVAATRRRVIISVWSVPPPAQDVALIKLVYGEEGEAVPGHRELLPVLWQMGILPDIRVLPNPFRPDALPQTEEQAVEYACQRVPWANRDETRERVAANVQALFAKTDVGYRPLWRPEAREMLITWETGSGGGARRMEPGKT